MKVFKYKNIIANLEEVSYIRFEQVDTRKYCLLFSMKNEEKFHTETSSKEEMEKIFNMIYDEMTTGE